MKLVKRIGNLILCAWFMLSSAVCMFVGVETPYHWQGIVSMFACLFLCTYFAAQAFGEEVN